MNKKHPISLAIGTEVALTKYASATWESWLTSDKALIVTGASAYNGGLQYSVNGCAWFDHRDLLWIKDPTRKSIAFASLGREDTDDDEDDEGFTEEDDMEPRTPAVELKRSRAAVKAMAGLKLKSRGVHTY
jgi:hypothetical protein